MTDKLYCIHCLADAKLVKTPGVDGRNRFHIECETCGARGMVGNFSKQQCIAQYQIVYDAVRKGFGE